MKILVKMLGPAIGCIIGWGALSLSANLIVEVLVVLVALYFGGVLSEWIAKGARKKKLLQVIITLCAVVFAVILVADIVIK